MLKLEKILLVDDESAVRAVLADLLRDRGYHVLAVTTARQAQEALKEDAFDLVISDLRLEGEDGIEFLRRVREVHPKLPLMVVTGFGTLESAVEAIHLSVFDYLTKPIDPSRLGLSLQRLQEVLALEAENTYLRQEVARKPGGGVVWGESPGMREVARLIERVSKADTTVLITGESGTGKEVVARALHERGRRAGGPFIRVNCAAIPANLLESEFFGHEKGAFTGAVARREGRFELADTGTLLLDEISEIPPELQVKLLRVLQEREFERVGGNKTLTVDVNLIATTNRDLAVEVRTGRFREDLFYRLNVVPIHVPPLREREDDLTALVRHFVEVFARKHGKGIAPLPLETQLRLRAYRWPGNVRELQNAVERAVILAGEDGILRPEDFPGGAAAEEEGLAAEVEDVLTVEEMERRLIARALRRCGGNRTHAAKMLGISLRTLRNKLKLYRQEKEAAVGGGVADGSAGW